MNIRFDWSSFEVQFAAFLIFFFLPPAILPVVFFFLFPQTRQHGRVTIYELEMLATLYP